MTHRVYQSLLLSGLLPTPKITQRYTLCEQRGTVTCVTPHIYLKIGWSNLEEIAEKPRLSWENPTINLPWLGMVSILPISGGFWGWSMALGKPTFVKGPVSSEKKVSGFASRTISCFSPKVACLSCFFWSQIWGCTRSKQDEAHEPECSHVC